MEQKYPGFTAALRALGKTRRERATKLQTDPKTVDRLFARLPKPLAILCAQPHLLRALADDLEAKTDTQNCLN